jgi:hypothetical protein
MTSPSRLLSPALSKLVGGITTVYVAGYLVLTAFYATYSVPLSRSLLSDEYLVTGAKFFGTVFGVVFGQLLLYVPALAAVYVASLWFKRPILSRLRRWERWIARPLHWAALLLTASICVVVAQWITAGRAGGTHRFELALTLAAVSMSLCAWLHAVGELWFARLALASTVVTLVLLPVAYGAIAKSPIVPYAELVLKERPQLNGGLIFETSERVAIVTRGGIVHVAPAGDVVMTLRGCFHLGVRDWVPCSKDAKR